MRYNKLVRDKIIEIIEAKGEKASFHLASADEYREALIAKLQEEVREFIEVPSPEELADIMEVVYSLGEVLDMSGADLEKLRSAKAEDRGAFKKRIILEESE